MKINVKDIESCYTTYKELEIKGKKFPNRKLRYFLKLKNGFVKEIDDKQYQTVLRCVCGMYIDGYFEI